jgi:thioredoxin-related protein
MAFLKQSAFGGEPNMQRLIAWLLPLSLAVAPGTASADEVQWRHDYNAARREAEEKNRPLMIDFGTQNCFWCKRLDMTTFKDPTVIALLNERFIPLKIDAEKDAPLAHSLNISSYPTIVLGAPDGKILGTIVGYKEAGEFAGILQRSVVNTVIPPPPDWMVRDQQEAAKAVARSDYGRAITLLKGIIEDGKDRPVQLKARQLLQDVEQQAAGRLARARQLENKGQSTEAIDILTELMRAYPGSQAATDASQLLNVLANKPDIKLGQRTRRARELLAQAKEDYRTQQFLCCLDRCELLAANYPDLPEGSEAGQLAGEIKNNPEWMKAACDSLTDRLGLLYLALAETWIKKSQPQQAIPCLERVIQACPGTREAEAAQIRLSYLKGQPTWQAEYKQPAPEKN